MSTLAASPIPPHISVASTQPSAGSSRPRVSPNGSPHSPQQQLHGSPRSNSSKDGSVAAVDADSVLRANGNDARRAIEALLADKQSSQAQNSQLWKLIEKQRSQCASLVADNDRLRMERERANSRLVAAGLEPVGGKKMSTSASASGLSVRAEPPPMRRHNSDREQRTDEERSDRASPVPVAELDPGATLKKKGSRNQLTVDDLVDKQSRPSLTVPSPNTSSQGSPAEKPSPTDKVLTSTLLPSPLSVQETKLRPQSRMVFPSEVSSWLSLADSPQSIKVGKDASGTPPVPASHTRSPAAVSPLSEITTNSNETLPPALPPSSSRALALSTETVPEEDESVDLENTNFQDIPPRSSSIRSPSLSQDVLPPSISEQSLADSSSLETDQISASEMELEVSHHMPETVLSGPVVPVRSSVDANTSRGSTDIRGSDDTTRESVRSAPQPPPPTQSLPRLVPALLPHTRLSIPSSTVFANSQGRDVLCFIVSVTIRPPNAQTTSWSVGKLFSAFVDLDTKIKARSGKSRKELKNLLAPLPDGKAWKDFAPSKIDQRKAALEAYLQSLLVAPLSNKIDLCEFLSTDPVHSRVNAARKEGYLTKKGKNFGGWKTRYFVLAGPVMEYYESRGGAPLGSILITNAQIGRQHRPMESSDDRDFRHAFLIIEHTKKGTTNRHVLCAESDAERDNWIELLVRYVDPETVNLTSAPFPAVNAPQPAVSNPPQATGTLTRKRSNSRKSSKDVVISAAAPLTNLGIGGKFGGAPSPSMFNEMESKKAANTAGSHVNGAQHAGASKTVSAPLRSDPSPQSGGPFLTVSQSSSMDVLSSSPSGSDSTSRSSKRQSMMPSRQAQTSAPSAAYLNKVASEGLSVPQGPNDRDRKAKSGRFWTFGKSDKTSKPVFGVPLVESIAVASKANLPAIVYRCIEYLEAKKAEEEEGIYRLSGSSAVIKGLKERFDNEGDVNLLKIDEYWDPHAIAGLLKGFLRELPTSLLTVDLHPRFLAVMDLIDSSARVTELSRLVAELPPPNYALLRALTAHLILVVKNSNINKMTLRNIGIVFSPTLGIPAGIFSELVTHFGAIFDDQPEEEENNGSGEMGNHADASNDTGDETVKRKRNSMLYQAGGADALLGLGGRSLDPALEDSASEASNDDIDLESETRSAMSDDNSPSSMPTPRAEPYPPAATVNPSRATNRAAEKGLVVETLGQVLADSKQSPNKSSMSGSPFNSQPPDSSTPTGQSHFRAASPLLAREA